MNQPLERNTAALRDSQAPTLSLGTSSSESLLAWAGGEAKSAEE